MKKVIALVTLLSLAVAFSCTVFAAGDGFYSYRTTKSATRTNNNVTVKVTGVELATPDYSYQTQQGIYNYYSTVNLVYTVTITNNNSSSYYLSSLWFRPVFDEATYDAYPTNIDNFSTDLIATIDSSNGSITIVPDADWSFTGHICIPANTSMTAVFSVGMYASKYSTSSTISSWFFPNLDSITVSSFTAYDTDFTPQGAHDDLLISLEALRNFLIGSTGIPAINSTLSAISSELVSILASVDDVERLLTWVGSYSPSGIGSMSQYTNSTNPNITVIVRNLGCRPITDFEVLPPNVVVSDVMYLHPVQIELKTSFDSDQTVSGSFVVNNFMAVGSSTFDNPIIYSDDVVVVTLASSGGYYSLYVRFRDNIISGGQNYHNIWINLYSRSSSMPVNSGFTLTANTSGYVSDISTDSADLKTKSDNVHSQEQAYFTQNSQAIQATGLGNYQFGTVEGNGIAAVSGDFTSVWNALNGWTSIYIFSLTLGVALTIIRHAPNSISRRIRNRQKE